MSPTVLVKEVTIFTKFVFTQLILKKMIKNMKNFGIKTVIDF